MSSEINGQAVTIQQLITPLGVGLTGGSPSISPIGGALGYDKVTPNDLYLGTGSVWIPIATGVANITDAIIGPYFLTGAGLPTLTAELYLQKIVGATVPMVYFQQIIVQTITSAVPGTWTSPVGTVPAAFRPTSLNIIPIFTTVDGSFQSGNSIMVIDTSGTITIVINFSFASSTVVFQNQNGNYVS